MKKYSFIIALVAIALFGGHFVTAHAEDSNTGSSETTKTNKGPGKYGEDRRELGGIRGDDFQERGKEVKGSIEDARAEFKARRDELKADFKAKLEEWKTKREELKEELKNKWGEARGGIFMRYTVAVERLTQLHTKMQTRIDKVKADGKNVDAAQTELDSSKSHLEEANDEIASAKALLDADTDGSNNQDIRTHLKSAKEHLKLAFTDLKDSFKELKEIVNPDDSSDEDESNDDSNSAQQ